MSLLPSILSYFETVFKGENLITPEELQELRDWSARKMGWTEKQYGPDWCYYLGTKYDRGDGYMIEARIRIADWQPDNPSTGQIWMLVERMRESDDLYLSLEEDPSGPMGAYFTKWPEYIEYPLVRNLNPCLAILKAAWATEG